jgi:hypothetical protein
MKIAMYRSLSIGYDTVFEANEWVEADDERARISEIIDIEFKPLTDKSIIEKQIAYIDNKINQIMAVSEKELTELKTKKAELLAIPDLSAES